MKPLATRVLTLVALFALPALAAAQKEPSDTKEIKDANKFLGLAMMQSAPDKKAGYYQQALKPLQEAMVKSPDNAKVWLMAGQVYSGLGDFAGADSAFKKAEQLYPPYAEEINGEREAAWVEAFNQGISLMDARDTDGAIQKLEMAEKLYAHRPESKMNLGSLYAQKGDTEKAIAAFESAIVSVNGPLKAQLKPEDAANWDRFAAMAKSNIAQLIGARGVEEFNAENWDAAITSFSRAFEVNPASRDYIFNRAQSLYAKASGIEEKRSALLEEAATLGKTRGQEAAAKAKTDQANAMNPELIKLYADIVEAAEKTRAFDPQNEALYHLIARSYKLTGDMTADTAQRSGWQQKALSALQTRDAMEFEVTEVAITPGEGNATVRGTVKNTKSAPNAPIKLKFTLLSLDGTPVGEQEITISAPAVDQTAPFEGTVTTTGDVAGWKYVVVK